MGGDGGTDLGYAADDFDWPRSQGFRVVQAEACWHKSLTPLMEEVRRHIVPLGVKSVLVQPLICHDDLLGAIFLRLSKSDEAFGREDQEFALAAASALANSIRNARLHTALRKKRDDLESAYVDRYRDSERKRRDRKRKPEGCAELQRARRR